MPDHVGLIFLSATSPNKEVFAEWVGRTKQKKVYVLGTPRRPVPLNHHLFLTDGSLHHLMDGNAVDGGDAVAGWKLGNYRAAAERLKGRMDKRGGAAAYGAMRSNTAGRSGGGTSREDQRVWGSLMAVLQRDSLLPAICFCFSKKRCEEVAFGLSATDLNTARERAAVHIFMEAAVRRLNGSDRLLPQVVRLRRLLLRGIGVHHVRALPLRQMLLLCNSGRAFLLPPLTFTSAPNNPLFPLCPPAVGSSAHPERVR